MNPNDLKRVIEALIFAADAPLTPERIRETLEACTDEEIARTVETLNAEYEAAGHSFMIRQVAGGYQVTTRPEFGNWIKKLYLGRQKGRLSQAGLESLAIIAFKQPISRVDIAQIRGVNSDGVIGTLLERKLITISGRSEAIGRPLLYSTTPEFLEFFGINDLAELPKPREIEELIGKEGMSEEVLQALSSDKQLKLPISFEPEAGAEQLTASNLVTPLMPLGVARPESSEPQEEESVAPSAEATPLVASFEEVEVENNALSSIEEKESEVENVAASSIETAHNELQNAVPAFIQTEEGEAQSVSPSLIETEENELQSAAPSFIQTKEDETQSHASSSIEPAARDAQDEAASAFASARIEMEDASIAAIADEAEAFGESLNAAQEPTANLIEPVTVVSQEEVAQYVPPAETTSEPVTVVPEETPSAAPMKKSKERKRGKRGAQLGDDNNGNTQAASQPIDEATRIEVEATDHSQTENTLAANIVAPRESELVAQASLPAEESPVFSSSPLNAKLEAENIFEEEARALAQTKPEPFTPEVIAVTEAELDSVLIDQEELENVAELEAGFNQKEAKAFFVDKKNEFENFAEAAPADEETLNFAALEADSATMSAAEPRIVAEEASAAFLNEPLENVTIAAARADETREEQSQSIWANAAVNEAELRAEADMLDASQTEMEVDTWPEITEVRIEEASSPALEVVAMPGEVFSQKENGKDEVALHEFENETTRTEGAVVNATSMVEPAHEEGADFFV